MTRIVSLILLVALLFGVAGPAASQGPGLFVRVDCTTITAPVTGQTWCFDATARALKVWNGSAYDSAPVPPATVATVVGSYGVRNLVGANNAASPNTKFDYSADLVVLRNTSDGSIVVRTNTTTLTNDTGLAGITANGRDQAGAFSASSWIHFYFIWNGTTLATLSSTVAPFTGPTLPTGYSHWAYVGAVRYNATPLLVKTYVEGAYGLYDAEQLILSAGVATSFTAVDLATLVPPNALRVRFISILLLTHTAVVDFLLSLRPTGSADASGITSVGVASIANVQMSSISMTEMKIGTSSQIDYKINSAPATSGGAYLSIWGYAMPNGGE